MNNLNIECFMDGNDYVVVFKNAAPETADIIKAVLNITSEPEKITGLKSEEKDESAFTYNRPIQCPVCGKNMKFSVGENSRERYTCDCGKSISTFACGRNLTNEEAKDVIENGKSSKKFPFISSKTNNGYNAFLYVSDDGKIKPDFNRKA